MGLPFRSGHVLAMRRFPASSVGPPYTSIWHRAPSGEWTFYTDAEPLLSCNRYFGGAVGEVRMCAIHLTWAGPFIMRIAIAGELVWESRLTEDLASRAMNVVAGWLPDALRTWPPTLAAMAAVAGPALHAGRLRLRGRAPNGQAFIAMPRRLWLIDDAHATVRGQDLGEVGPLARAGKPRRLLHPQRGLFVIGRASFEAFDPALHRPNVTATE
jgi:hypothetical protein